MDGQEIFNEEIIHKIETELENHVEQKAKKQKKILNLAVKHLRRLAMDKINNRVGEC